MPREYTEEQSTTFRVAVFRYIRCWKYWINRGLFCSISSTSEEGFIFDSGESAPLLVVGEYGAGSVAAFASDVAPHWVGGFVDWGEQRISAQAEGSDEVEVGSDYARFFSRLVEWTMG